MRPALLLIAIPLILLAGCTGKATTDNCAEICNELVRDVIDVREGAATTNVNCPFDTCFTTEPYVKESYFTYKTIAPIITDDLCNDAFEERYNATAYLCFTKQAEPLVRTGRDAEGKDTWQWRIDCACSYQP